MVLFRATTIDYKTEKFCLTLQTFENAGVGSSCEPLSCYSSVGQSCNGLGIGQVFLTVKTTGQENGKLFKLFRNFKSALKNMQKVLVWGAMLPKESIKGLTLFPLLYKKLIFLRIFTDAHLLSK